MSAGVRADAASTPAQAGSASSLPVDELVLDNGMRVLLAPRPGPGLVAAAWAVRRGSGDEPRGKSGVAHLLEHLLHNGSTNVTASDYARLYTEAGAVGIDARTDRDVTAYFLQLPPERLELWFWLESDRLLHPAWSDVDREVKVIAEERRQRLESTPLGAVEETIRGVFWGDHPYGGSVGGEAADLARATRSDAEAFFAANYGAGEITVVLVGDFVADNIRELARRYFGRLPRTRPGAPVTVDPRGALTTAHGGTGTLTPTCACPPQARILYPTVTATDPDRPALDVLAGILAGRSARLQRKLVDSGLAFAATARHESGCRGGAFTVEIEARGGVAPQTLVAAWDAELARLLAAPPTAEEMERVRNQVTTDAWRGMRDPLDFALRLLVADAQGGWRSLESWPRAVLAVEPADVQRVAHRYLVVDSRLVTRISRSER